MFLNRNNDLQEFFWPIYYFTKEQILVNHQFPLWNNLFFSGMPLLPDPQSPLFYLPNIIFLLFPIDLAFIISISLHFVIAGICMYLCSRKAFGFSTITSIFTALFFITSPKFAGFLEAGHFGLILAYSWLPLSFLSTISLSKTFNIKWVCFLVISLTAIFYTHLVTFLLTLFSVSLMLGYLVLTSKKKLHLVKMFLLSILITFGLVAIALIPQLEWKDSTTRFMSLNDRIVYPNWNSKGEFITNIFASWSKGISYIQSIETEKWIPLPITLIILALFGFFKLQKKLKIFLSLVILIILVLILNNSSPLYRYLLSQDWYVLLRVTTRAWFIVILVVTFLAGYAINSLLKSNKFIKTVSLLTLMLVIIESATLSFIYLNKPISNPQFISPKFFEFLKEDKDRFRVFCVSRCISQKDVAIHNIELIEGYNTIQQINYYRQAWQLTGAYWNYYTLSIPPIGTYTFEKPQPDPISLGDYNTKYIVSPYKLDNSNFILVNQFENFLVYRNNLWLSRSYFSSRDKESNVSAPILIYTPNHIRVDTSTKVGDKLVLAEVYSPGWKAYLDGHKQVLVQEKPDALRLVDIDSDTKFVDFKYEPDGFKKGALITIFTLLITLIFIIRSLKK